MKNEKIKLALSEAIAAIYFNDSSDYLGALWNIIHALNPEAHSLLIKNEHAAYDKYAKKE